MRKVLWSNGFGLIGAVLLIVAAPAGAAPGTAIDRDGTYKVGVDIQPGLYHTEGNSEFCYWERLSGFSGELDDVIANDIVENGPATVEIRASDRGFKTQGCGSWVL